MAAHRTGAINPETGRAIIKIGKARPGDLPLQLPCGRCMGCRMDNSRQWAVRLMHEAQLHENNCYITLTYSEENVPKDYSIKKRHFTLFMKKIRKQLQPKKIKYFNCGEYGTDFYRPHFHSIIFNHDFEDKQVWKKENGNVLYTSAELSQRWGHGFCSLGAVTFKSAAYVASYTLKKITGEKAKNHYRLDIIDPETGEVLEVTRTPEYAGMSNGLAKKWLAQFKADVYPHGYVVVNGGHRSRPPRYYEKITEKTEPEVIRALAKARRNYAHDNYEDNTPTRLAVREEVQERRLAIRPRKIK